MAAIERGLSIFIPPMAAAAFAALKLLTQFGNLEGSDRETDTVMQTYRCIQSYINSGALSNNTREHVSLHMLVYLGPKIKIKH